MIKRKITIRLSRNPAVSNLMIALRSILFLALSLVLSSAAHAQGTQCRTDLIGSKSANCASEEFVTDSIAGAVPPQGIANSIFINPTNAPATMQNIAVPACANDGVHALVYVNGSGLQCVAIAIITTVGGVLSGTLPNPLYKGFAAADIASLNLSALSTFETCGYATCGDGGQAWYVKIGGTNNFCSQTDSTSQVWRLDPKKPVNPMSCGAKFDHSTNDSTAIQNAISWAENVPNSNAGEPHGGVVCPIGETAVIATTLTFTNPITFDCQTRFFFTGANSEAFSVGKVAGTGNGQNWIIHIRALECSGAANQIGVHLYYINFSWFTLDEVDNCNGAAAFYCDGTGATRTPQIIQHNTFNLGQVVNNTGLGILLDSLNAATSSCEANVWNVQNSYQNGENLRVDQSGHVASTSNTFNMQSMDNATSGTVAEVFGGHNIFNINFYAGQIVLQASASLNMLILGNQPPAATVSNLGGATNKCWVVGALPATC